MTTGFLYFILAVILILIALMLGRVIKGPTVYDRLNGLSVIEADTILLFLILGELDGRIEMFVDIAITYAILIFVSSVILGKYLGGKHQ